jgi:hypothetical protein
MSEREGLPILPHLAGEFYTWLWWRSEAQENRFDLGGDVGPVELWVDERLAFRTAGDTKVVAVLTGDNPSTALEARAALVGGKVVHELRFGMRRDDREFLFTLKGAAMDLQGVKLPQVLADGAEEALFDRMFHYDELCHVLAAFYTEFARIRTTEGWKDDVLPGLQAWMEGRA